jgi:dTDP-4-amino-4,6-dideoxygalactose transaminase
MIHMNEFKDEPEDLLAAQARAAERVIRSGWYILGNELKRFEKAFADWTGLPHMAGVGNGMDAIEIGLRAAGIGPGDEVITTPMTAFATVLAIYRSGATPVLADIDSDTALLDLASVDRCVTKRTKGVLLVHLYGRVPDMDAWRGFCVDRGIRLFEDCAQAHGARWKGEHAGTFGAFGAFSFYPTKNLGAIGDGGALGTTSADLDAKARVLRNYGQSVRYHHEEIGLNSRLDELQAAILAERLLWLDRFIERRRQIAARYDQELRNSLIRPLTPPPEKENHAYHLYVVRCNERDRLSAHLKERGVETLIHYPVPAHRQKPTLDIRRDPKGLTAAERHGDTCLSLPCHPQMSDEDVTAVIEGVNSFA